ncbi:MAG: electron transfer flavoprotein subunit alpha, partial [Actinomycetota bacterium]
MSDVLVLVEHTKGEVKKVSLELLAMAAKVGTPVAVALGPGADATVAALGDYGAKKVFVDSSDVYANEIVVPAVTALTKLVSENSPSAVLIPSSGNGKEIAARLALACNSGVITDASDIAADGSITQNIFGGATIVTAKVTTGTPIITVRVNSIPPVVGGGSAEVVNLSVDHQPATTTVTNRVAVEKSGRPDLSEAEVVVSGGRGVASEDGFKSVIEPL